MSSTESVSPHDVIVCACGTHEYTARDAIDAAIFRGELEEKWQRFSVTSQRKVVQTNWN